IQGFHVTRAEVKGIYLQSDSSGVVVRANQVDYAYRFGIALNGCSGVLVERNGSFDNRDHGIALTSSSGCTVQDNESCRNLSLQSGGAANGIYLWGAPNTLLQRNRLHDNQDTGLQIGPYSNGCVSVQNQSWRN